MVKRESFQRGGQQKVSKMDTSSRTPRPMTPGEIEAAGLSDPDAQPLTNDDFKRLKKTPQAKIIRRALGFTQAEFAARYRIPLGTLRDWEQGRAEPDQPTRAYLAVIAHDPEGVRRALQKA
jgi:putative transcriptional regulator